MYPVAGALLVIRLLQVPCSVEFCVGGRGCRPLRGLAGLEVQPGTRASSPRHNKSPQGGRDIKIVPEFPEHRLNEPKWQPERRVYEAFQACDLPGMVLYGVRAGSTGGELDSLVLLEGLAHLAMEFKGGQHRIVGTEWQLRTPTGWEKESNPLTQVWDAAMEVRDALGEHTARKPFLVPVLVFPDMEEDETVGDRAVRARVHVIFGVGGLAEKLLEVGAELVMPDATFEEDTAGKEAAPEELNLQVRQVVIQHAEVVNIHTTAERA